MGFKVKKNRYNEEEWSWTEKGYHEEFSYKEYVPTFAFRCKWLFYLLTFLCVAFLLLNGIKAVNAVWQYGLFSGYSLFLLTLEGVYAFYLRYFILHGASCIPLHSLLLLAVGAVDCYIWSSLLSAICLCLFIVLFVYILFRCLFPKRNGQSESGKTKVHRDRTFSLKTPFLWIKRHVKRYSIAQVEELELSYKEHYDEKVSFLESENRKLRKEIADLIRQKDENHKRSWERSFEEFFNKKKPVSSEVSFSFFAGCKTASEVKKRYTKLSSAYHPDNPYGNETIMKQVNEQYQKEMQKY